MKTIENFWNMFKKNSSQQEKSAENLNSTQHEEKSDVNQPTTDKARIYNLIIVDESGSMSHLRKATLSGINETIATIRTAQDGFASSQDHILTLVTFDSSAGRPAVRKMIDNKPINKVNNFKDYCPRGCTPLYDAMGQSLTELYDQIKNDADATAVVTVLTDGLENSSLQWNATELRQLIEKLKEIGWSFSYMGSAHDVKEVTDLLAIENVVEFSHDDIGATSTWRREQSSRRAYYEKMDEMYRMEQQLSKKEKMERKRRYAKEYYGQRVSPDQILHLEENEIFVFGSNANGIHQGGASAFAYHHFGAVMGKVEGLQGQSYAIPTMEGFDNMRTAIQRFARFAESNPQLRFLVTRIGCGVAGYDVSKVAPLFEACIHMQNVALPADFWKALGLTMYESV